MVIGQTFTGQLVTVDAVSFNRLMLTQIISAYHFMGKITKPLATKLVAMRRVDQWVTKCIKGKVASIMGRRLTVPTAQGLNV